MHPCITAAPLAGCQEAALGMCHLQRWLRSLGSWAAMWRLICVGLAVLAS